jgi:RNA polymerase sigma-70 factor (ECF subfamily)
MKAPHDAALDPFASAGPSPAAERDADLVALLKAGDAGRAFDGLLARYEGRVYRLCCTLLREPAAAEDAAQEALLRVWRALPRYDAASGALSTWIYAITRNRCLTVLSQRREASAPGPAGIDDETLETLVAEVPAPTGPVDDDGVRALRGMVEALPETQRNVIRLFYYEDRAVGEVAQMLGMPENTVKTHLHRGRTALLDRLQRDGLAQASHWFQGGEG